MRSRDSARLLVLAATALVASGASDARTDGRDSGADVARPQVGCAVQGVWDLVARTIDGKDAALKGVLEL